MMTPEQTRATHPPTCSVNQGVLSEVCPHCRTGTPFTPRQLATFAWRRAWETAPYPPGVRPGPFTPSPGVEIYRAKEAWIAAWMKEHGHE